MTYIVCIIVGLIGLYLIINGKRNSDPMNRKCAAEICEYFAENRGGDPAEIAKIFIENARYRKQANHILSMVPSLLVNAGFSKEDAMVVVPLLRAGVSLVPK